jgi:eukaryotic-like serine/threonine-protein kinase
VGVAVDQDHNSLERTVVDRRDAMIGQTFDRRFQIDARIAAGGFGAIYRATHIKSGHQLALKVLHRNLTGDPGVVARFRREGAALTRLRDPHTITAYELGESADGTLYIVMELLRGESLYDRFRATGPLPWQRVFAIARAVCSSLTEAHALGIIHRDLKPTNIHLEPVSPDEDHVKVLDFGIAKIVQHSDIDASELTHAGQMIGTLDYMSPEQMVGGECHATSDIYTLGIVMYEMITGRKPFEDANSAAAALAAVLTTTPPRLTKLAGVPGDVDRLVMRCIERHHADRFQSATDLAEALDEVSSSGEEAVTTVDLTHPIGGVTTIKGMRLPAKLPPAAAEIAQGTATAKAAGSIPPTVVVSPDVAEPTPSSAAPSRRSSPVLPKLTPTGTEPLPLIDTTMVGPIVPPRAPARRPRGSRPRPRPTGAPQVPPTANLREAYPTIHRSPPSPMQPRPTAFDDHPPSSVGTGKVFDMSSAVRRDAYVRHMLVGIAVALAILLVLLFYS